jgi:hypothetical protein
MTAEDGHAMALVYLGVTLAHLGYFDQAQSQALEGLLEARRLQNAYTTAFCLILTCWIAFLANLPYEVRRYAQEAFDLSNEHGFPLWAAWGIIFLGWSSAAIDRAADSVALIANAVSMLRSTETVIMTSVNLALLAEACASLGQTTEGLSRLREAASFIEATGERNHEAGVYRLQGDSLSANDDQGAAEHSYHRALAIADRQNAKALKLRAATSLARLWCDQSKRTEARDLLAPIYGWFTEGFDTPVLQDAKALATGSDGEGSAPVEPAKKSPALAGLHFMG